MKIQDIKKGQLFYEGGYGTNVEAVAMEDCKVVGDLEGRSQHGFRARNTQTGEDINYLMTEGLSHYGPSLHPYPAYARFSGPGREMVFPLVCGDDYDMDDEIQKSLRDPDLLMSWANADVNMSVVDWIIHEKAASMRESLFEEYPEDSGLAAILDSMVHDTAAQVSMDQMGIEGSVQDEAVEDLHESAIQACDGGPQQQLVFLLKWGMTEEEILRDVKTRDPASYLQM